MIDYARHDAIMAEIAAERAELNIKIKNLDRDRDFAMKMAMLFAAAGPVIVLAATIISRFVDVAPAQ